MKKKIPWILPGMIILILDRVIKVFIGDVHAVLIPGVIALRSAKNTGMALGLFQGGAWAILAVSLVLVIAAYFLLRDMRLAGWAPVGISLMAGGALGNMMDRAALGYVIDMFDFCLINFAVFNFADICITIGGALFVLLAILDYKAEVEAEKAKKPAEMEQKDEEQA